VKHEHPGAGLVPIAWRCHVDVDEIAVIEFDP
jgi:hypothetical protein